MIINKSSLQKIYKSLSITKNMNLQYLFYVLGIIFLFATVSYFSFNFLFDLPDGIKTIILVLTIIIFFVLGEVMEDKDI